MAWIQVENIQRRTQDFNFLIFGRGIVGTRQFVATEKRGHIWAMAMKQLATKKGRQLQN